MSPIAQGDRTLRRARFVLLACALFACEKGAPGPPGGDGGHGGGGAGGAVDAPLDYVVVEELVPTLRLPDRSDGTPRPVAAARDERGRVVEFVEDEVLLQEAHPGELARFLERWPSTWVESVSLGTLGLAHSGHGGELHLLRVDASDADPSRLGALASIALPRAEARIELSSDAGARTLTAIAELGIEGLLVSPNFLVPPASIESREVEEAPAENSDPGFSSNTFLLPGFAAGDAQDIGVGEAWRMLADAGRSDRRVPVAVIDAGFSKSLDLPARTRLTPTEAWDRASALACADGSACPWHGTEVAEIIGARIDNGFGASGVAGQVAELSLLERPSLDLFSSLAGGLRTFGKVPAASPRVLNLSASLLVPDAIYVLQFGVMDGIFASLHWLLGVVVVAPAGNDGIDLDEGRCKGTRCWEESTVIPCEAEGVVCVGGLERGQVVAAPASNRGANRGIIVDRLSVDVFAPFWNWVGPDRAAPPDENRARLVPGTSGAAAFVSGVFALLFAAEPALEPEDALRIVLETAKRDVTTGQRRIDAKEAVRRALGGNAPPFVRLEAPASGAQFAQGVEVQFAATVEDREGGEALSWASDRDGVLSGAANFVRADLSPGQHVISLSVKDDPWLVVREATITVVP